MKNNNKRITVRTRNLLLRRQIRMSLTTSEKATERDPRNIQKAALNLLSTKVDIKLQERAPRSPDRTRYDLLR